VRKYDSVLESALDKNNIPMEVYHSLVENVNNNLDKFHRYLAIKKRVVGLDTLKYSDMYVLGVDKTDDKYPYERASEIILDSLQPLGKDYVETVRKSINERWIDVYPTPGKYSGAYCSGGGYDLHPFMLLNYNEKYDDVSTMTHELGHAMHSYFTNKTQPYPTSHYSTFVAEVASTFNEVLLGDKMLKDSKDQDQKLFLLLSYLDGIKGTLFRQTQFAEFELKMYELAEQGKPLTGDVFTKLYGDILKKYYGHDKGICQIDDLYTVEWAYVPHFYNYFYVYQYATSFTASAALAERVMNNEPGAVEKYLGFLSAGNSEYPIDILKKAGVDLTGSKPFDQTMDGMVRVMDQVEKILDNKGL
jgi:oligoendopeptidase F